MDASVSFQYFDSRSHEVLTNGTWTAPLTITKVILIGCGGGGGGGGYNGTNGGGGHAAPLAVKQIAVTPGQTYNITIGAGGSPSASGLGNTGGSTTFSTSGGTVLATFPGARGGWPGGVGTSWGESLRGENGPFGRGGNFSNTSGVPHESGEANSGGGGCGGQAASGTFISTSGGSGRLHILWTEDL